MKVILLIISSLFIAARSASVAPVEQSSSTVKVKQGDTEYSYSIHDGREIAPEKQETVLPLETDEIPQQILVTTLQPNIGQIPAEISGQLQRDQIQEKELSREKDARFIASMEQKEIENQPQEEMVIGMPVNREIKGLELEGIGPQEELKMSKLSHREVKGLDNQPLEELSFSVPGYRVLKDLEWKAIANLPQEELRISVPAYRELKGLELKAIENQPQEELKITVPGYRLIPTTSIQYIDQPQYYPYYNFYGSQYPYNFVRYL